jgi:tetratricopeptide (TPR) repeat protein
MIRPASGRFLVRAGIVAWICLAPAGMARGEGRKAEQLVIPPGQEELFRRMLDPEGAPCRLQQIAIEAGEVRGTYRCREGIVEARLRPGQAGDGIRLALEVSPGNARLAAALEESVRRLEGRAKAERPAAREPEPPAPAEPEAPPPEYDPPDQARYDRAEDLIKEGRCPEALEILESMARERPISQTLGLVVVCLAADALDPERVRQEVARSEARPDDPLSAFRAGVISHYAGHRLARTREQKAAFYRDAIRFLDRALPAYDQVTRVHLYRAVSLYRLGRQAEAESAIERAVTLAERTRDADAWYCRAEIRHRKDLDGALKDIETYFEVMAPNIAAGAIHSPAKQRRVREMQARLERARAGAEPLRPDEELFDPLPDPVASWVGRHGRILVLSGILALAGLAGIAFRRARHRSRSRPRQP